MLAGKESWEMSPSKIQSKVGERKGMNLVINTKMDGSEGHV